MNKTKLLLDVVNDVKALGASLEVLADAFVANEESASVAGKPKESVQPQPADSKMPRQKVTLEDVRAVLARKSQAGFTAQIQSIIQRFDAKKLSDVAPEHYEEILLSAEELSHE